MSQQLKNDKSEYDSRQDSPLLMAVNQQQQGSEGNYKIGNIFKRSEILKKWNKRCIILDKLKRTMSLRSGKKAKEKVVVLENYEVSWVGSSKKSRMFLFCVKAMKNISQQKYKAIYLGGHEEQEARQWMNEIASIIEGKKENIPPLQLHQQLQRNELILEKTQSVQERSRPIEVNCTTSASTFVQPANGKVTSSKSLQQCEEDVNVSGTEELRPNEHKMMVPNFNDAYGLSFIPKKAVEDPEIEQACANAPESIRQEVRLILEGYSKRRKVFLDHVFGKKGEQCDKNIWLKDNYYILLQEVEGMAPEEIFEEIQTPSTKEHWNEVIGNYSIQPVSDQPAIQKNLLLTSFTFRFNKGDGQVVDKEIASYRYHAHIADGFFLWEFQHLNIDKESADEEGLKNKISNTILIISDPLRENVSLILIKVKFSFSNESPELEAQNSCKYLQGFESIIKCQVADPEQDEIEVEYLPEDGESEEEIDSKVFISVRIDRQVTNGNTEEDFSDQQIEKILVSLATKSFIKDCITAKHERRIVSGVYKRIKWTKERGHHSWKFDYKRDDKKGGLNYYNERLMKEQKTVLMSILKRIGSNIMNGKSIMSISMPVILFEQKSMIQRLAKGFGHAPDFLEKGGLINSNVEQIKYTAAFLLSSFIMGFQQEKPFNPIIGETVQMRMNGCPLYFEQTSHHPPISHYQLYGRGYDLYGCHIPMVAMSANSLQGQMLGNPTIHFKNTNLKIRCLWNSFTVYNTVFGQRSINAQGRSYVFDAANNLALEIVYNPNNTKGLSSLFSKKFPIDEVSGAIYRITPAATKKLMDQHKPLSRNLDFALDPTTDILQLISKLEGYWCKYIDFDGVRYWDDSKDEPYVCEYENCPLPSDARFREDLLYFQKNNLSISQTKKEEMEEAQRYDQKLRDKYKQKLNKK